MLKNLINKPNQSPIVIVQLIKFATNKIFSFIETVCKNNDNTSVLDNNEDTHSKNIAIEPDVNDLNSTNNSNSSDNDTLRQFMAVLKIIIMDNPKSSFIFNSEEEKIKNFKNEFYENYKNAKFKSIRQLIIDLCVITEEEDYIKNQNTISNYNSMLKDKDVIESNSLKNVGTDPNISNIVTLQRNTNTSGLNSSSLRKYNPSSIYQLTSSTNTSNIIELKTDGNNFKFNNNPKLPFARIAVDATLTINQINSTFLKELKKLGFEVLGNETSEYCKAEKRKFDFFNTIMKCFRSDSTRGDDNNLTSLYLMTKFSEHNKFERIIEVVGLTGKNEELSETIEHFLKKLRVHNKKLRPLRVQDINTKVLDSKRSKSSEKLNKEKG